MKNLLSKFKGLAKLRPDPEAAPDNEISCDITMHAKNIKYLNAVLSKACRKCNCVKPPSSHHCGTCKRCVARMDHHCPWVNNCVGFYN